MKQILRYMKSDDLDLVLEWRNHPDVRMFMFSQQVVSQENHYSWYDRMEKDESRCLLIYEERNEPKGFIQFSPVKETSQVVEWGFYISPYAEKGTGTRMAIQALNFVFDVLCVHKVYAEVLDYNEVSIYLHNKLGFIQEGILRDHHLLENSYHSVLCFGLIKHEWKINQ